MRNEPSRYRTALQETRCRTNFVCFDSTRSHQPVVLFFISETHDSQNSHAGFKWRFLKFSHCCVVQDPLGNQTDSHKTRNFCSALKMIKHQNALYGNTLYGSERCGYDSQIEVKISQ